MIFAQQCKRRKNLESQSINEEEAMVEEKELRTIYIQYYGECSKLLQYPFAKVTQLVDPAVS